MDEPLHRRHGRDSISLREIEDRQTFVSQISRLFSTFRYQHIVFVFSFMELLIAWILCRDLFGVGLDDFPSTIAKTCFRLTLTWKIVKLHRRKFGYKKIFTTILTIVQSITSSYKQPLGKILNILQHESLNNCVNLSVKTQRIRIQWQRSWRSEAILWNTPLTISPLAFAKKVMASTVARFGRPLFC